MPFDDARRRGICHLQILISI